MEKIVKNEVALLRAENDQIKKKMQDLERTLYWSLVRNGGHLIISKSDMENCPKKFDLYFKRDIVNGDFLIHLSKEEMGKHEQK